MKRLLLALLIFGTWPGVFATAQTPDEDADRGVARISVMNGDVSVRRGDSGDWVAAAVNAPLVVPDSVLVGNASRAEIQLDSANMLRMAENSEVRLSELEYARYQLQISQGTVTFSVIRDSDADVDLSTPNVSIRPLKKGRYRISVSDAGITEITVRAGQAEVFTPTGVEILRSGKAMIVRGTASNPEFQLIAAIVRDDWDHWNEQRDKELKNTDSYRYVSQDIYGAEDLHGHGRWVYVHPYGYVWSPYVATGWAPYRHGRWSWVDWYGWSWVSYDPWGWAPYHYGRWFNSGPYGWCWYPGGMHVRHHWRPALVAFFGWNNYSGFNVGIGLGFGHIGWVPLAPYETYHPWYGHRYYNGYRNKTYIDNSVNIVNNVNITNIYRNAKVNNAITAVNGDDFVHGRTGNLYRASSNELRRTNMVQGQLPMVPQRESLRVSDRQVRAENLPTRSREAFASRRQVTSSGRVPFEDQQRGMERVARRTISGEQSPRTTPTTTRSATQATRETQRTPARVTNNERTGATSGREASTGWRRFGEPVRTGADAPNNPTRATAGTQTRQSTTERSTSRTATQGETTGTSGTSGWRRFGEPTRTQRQTITTRENQATETRRVAPTTSNRSSGTGSSSTPGVRDRSTTTRSTTERQAAPRTTAPTRVQPSRTTTPSRTTDQGSSTRSLPIRPPVVRQRSTPSSSRQATPSRQAAPSRSTTRSAPRSAPAPTVRSAPARTSTPSRSSGASSSRSSGGSSSGSSRSSGSSGRTGRTGR